MHVVSVANTSALTARDDASIVANTTGVNKIVMTDSNKRPEIDMPEPGKRQHINIRLFADDRFPYENVLESKPAIMVEELSLYPDICIAWGHEARGHFFVGQRAGRIATLSQLEHMPEAIQDLVKELLTQFPESQTP